jgi:dihydroflavonol-4-reductase
VSHYFVTGATGFLGRHLVDALLRDGHLVTALVRKPTAELPKDVVQVEGDILDRRSLDRALKGTTRFEGVFHCAGKVSRRPEDAEELHRVHVEGTKNVADATATAGIRRLVIASTSGTIAVSTEPDRVATEEDEAPLGLLSRWPYYRSKRFAESAALERHGAPLGSGAEGTLEVVSVNPSILFGPGDVNGSSTEDIRLFLERRVPAIPPGGLSYVDARDAAVGMRLAMERGLGGRRYLLGSCNLTIKELFARLERVSGVKGPLVPMPAQGRAFARTGAELLSRFTSRLGVGSLPDPVSIDMAHHTWYLDATRAETELGWTPRDPLETLVDTVADLTARGVVWFDPESSILSILKRRLTDVRETP